MFEQSFAFSPTATNPDQFFNEFIETVCVDATPQLAANSAIASPKAAVAATLLTPDKLFSYTGDSFLRLLDDEPFDHPTSDLSALLAAPYAQQQQQPIAHFFPQTVVAAAATQAAFIAEHKEMPSSAIVAQNNNNNKKMMKKQQDAPSSHKQQQKKKCAATKKKTTTMAPIVVDPERIFKTVSSNNAAGDVVIKVKTRRDQPNEAIPERLYNSIKYTLVQTANGFPEHLAFILARVRAVDAETLESVQKNGKEVLKGTVEAALTKSSRNQSSQFEGSLYVQFTEVSYHVDKREYCFEVSYFTPDDLENPILIKRSAPFKSFARKPNKKRGKKDSSAATSAKRKREEPEEDDYDEEEEPDESDQEAVYEQQQQQQQTPKRKKNQQQQQQSYSSDFALFVAKADELLEFNKKLDENERKQAISLIIQKFYQIDPTFTTTALFPTAAAACTSSFHFPPTASNAFSFPLSKKQ